MKKLFLLLILLPGLASAQYSYDKFSAALGVGTSMLHGDVNKNDFPIVIEGSLRYNLSPFADIGIDVNVGKIASTDGDVNSRRFSNSFYSVALTAKVQAAQFFDHSENKISNILGRFYLGTGLGMINSKVDRAPISPSSSKPNEMTSDFYKDSDFMLPINLGIRIPVVTKFDKIKTAVYLNYGMHISYSDELDGYDSGASDDYYSTLTAGLVFNLAGDGSYIRKRYQ